jgi:hypothetical protein
LSLCGRNRLRADEAACAKRQPCQKFSPTGRCHLVLPLWARLHARDNPCTGAAPSAICFRPGVEAKQMDVIATTVEMQEEIMPAEA